VYRIKKLKKRTRSKELYSHRERERGKKRKKPLGDSPVKCCGVFICLSDVSHFYMCEITLHETINYKLIARQMHLTYRDIM
jgi:hypothetical protein